MHYVLDACACLHPLLSLLTTMSLKRYHDIFPTLRLYFSGDWLQIEDWPLILIYFPPRKIEFSTKCSSSRQKPAAALLTAVMKKTGVICGAYNFKSLEAIIPHVSLRK